MELNEINESYKKSQIALKKVDTDKTKQIIEQRKKELIVLTDKLSDLKTEKQRAIRDKDKAREQNADNAIKQATEEIKRVKTNLGKLHDLIAKSKTNVDNQLKAIEDMAKTNPDLKKQLDEAIKVKFGRELKRKEAEKAKISEKLSALQTIKAEAEKNPNIMHLIMNIEDGYTLIAEQQKILDDPKTSDSEKNVANMKIKAFNTQLETYKANLAKHFKGKIKREDIDSIKSYSGLNREVKSLDRQVKGIDKQINNYTTAIGNIEHQMTTPESGDAGLPAPITKPKWYQFIKRFKNWLQNRKEQKEARKKEEESEFDIPLEEEPEQSPEQEQEQEQKQEQDKFKDSLKFDVVRDYTEKLGQEYLKQAKQANKETQAQAQNKDSELTDDEQR